MNLRSLFALAAGVLAFTGGALSSARSFELATPVARDNLAVYFVRGKGAGAAAPLTLEQALATGAVRVNEGPYHPITIENLSDQSVFIPFGTLLVGGLQDQVVAQDTILPPRGRMPLEVFCVDPFRSVARGNEDPTAFSSTGALFPSRTARLALLAGSGDNKAVENLRQYGLWWSIETVRAQLTRVLGEALEPPLMVTWKNDELREARSATILKARPSSSRTSLPRALENRKLADVLQSYLDLGVTEAEADDVIGAVFAINGRIEGAEIYQSHELFGRLWPSLLRAYATQALAASDATAEILPPVPVVQASLAAAQAAPQRTPDSVVRETEDIIYTETRTTDGAWIHLSFVPKLTQAVDTPDAVMAGILQSGEILGQPITALGDLDVVLSQDATSGHWSATVSTALLEQSLARLFRPGSEWRDQQRDGSGVPWALALLPWLVGAFVVALRHGAAALGRGLGRLGRALAAGFVAVAKPAIAAATVAAIDVLVTVLRLLVRAAADLAHLRQVLADRLVRPIGPALRLAPVYARPALRGRAH